MIYIQDICSGLMKEKTRLIERCLVGAIEQIEGRIPTNQEVIKHGRRLLHLDGAETFEWKGVPIVWIARDPVRFADHKMIFEIKTVFKDTMRTSAI